MTSTTTTGDWAERAGRIGLVAKGVVYCLLGTLAVAVAVGSSSGDEQVDQRGAMAEVAERPFGRIALFALALGLLCYAAWRILRMGRGEGAEEADAKSRVMDLGRALISLGLAASALRFATRDGGGQEQGAEQGLTARLMQEQGWGRAAVGLAGAVVVGAGLWQIWRGVSQRFRKRISEAVGDEHRAAVAVGVAGHVARGAVIAVAGLLVVRAAVRFDPQQPVGVDAALREVAAQSYGPLLLGAAALGLVAYGLYSFAEAKYRQVR